jgi:hypothetical protein
MYFFVLIIFLLLPISAQKPKERAKHFNNLRFLSDRLYNKLHNFEYKDTFLTFEELGPFKTNITNFESQGIGRINDILLDDTNLNNILIGSASGGLWKTNNGGNSWEYIKNEFGIFGVSKLYKFGNRVYILTGDSELSNISSAYSIGLLYTDDNFQSVNKIHISDNQKLLLTSLIQKNNKLYLTSNEGLFLIDNNDVTNIKKIEKGIYRSIIEFKDKLYFSYLDENLSEIIQYDIESSNFATIYSDSTSRIELINPESDPENLYALIAEKNLSHLNLIKTNDLTSWTNVLQNSPILQRQLDYNLAIEFAPYSKNICFLGGVPFLISTNNFNNISHNKDIHFDIHSIKIHKLTNDIYVASDGGLHKISNNFSKTEFLSFGKSITQFFDFDVSPNNKDIISAGAMDNGTLLYKNNKWEYIGAGDGMTTIFINDNQLLTSTQRGGIFFNNFSQNTSFSLSSKIIEKYFNPFYTLYLYENDTLFYFSNQLIIHDLQNDEIKDFQPLTDLINCAIKVNHLIYYAFKGTIVEYNLQTQTSQFLTSEQFIISHLKLIDNKLYFSSSSYDHPGLYFLDLSNKQVNEISSNLSKIPINTFDINHNQIYFGTDKGIYLFEDSEIIKLKNNKIDIGVVSKIKIRNDFDYLYLSTFSNGLFRIKLNNCNIDEIKINISDTISICKGDSLKLEILNFNPTYKYYLNTGDNLQNINYLNNNGEYFIIAESDNCKTNSKIFNLKHIETNKISILAPNGLEVCENDSILLLINDFTIPNQNIIWNDGQIGRNIRVKAGSYFAKITNHNECDILTDTLEVTNIPLPQKPNIQKQFNLIQSDIEVDWYLNDSLISSNSNFININSFGKYSAISKNERCSNSSDTIEIKALSKLNVYPNPTENELNFELFLEKDIKITLKISDLSGKIVYTNEYETENKPIFEKIDVSYLIKGIYILSIEYGNTFLSSKFLKL